MEDLKTAEERKKINTKKHLFGDANVFSKLFFIWSFPLFYQGLKRDLNEGDLFPPLRSHNSKILGDKLEAAWQYELKRKKNPSLWWAIIKVFKKDLIVLACLQILIELVLRLSQPLALNKLLQYFQPDSLVTKNEAYVYASVIVLGSLLTCIFSHHTMMQLFHIGMKVRVACCALVYRKALRLSKSSLAETTIGQMVNLLSNDVTRFDLAAIHMNSLWITPLLLIVTLYLLSVYVDYSAMIGIAVLLIFIPLQMWMGKKASIYRFRTALRTDERIRLMNEIISGIQVIKMYTWEKPFAKLVETSRKKEVRQILNNSIIRAITLCYGLLLNRLAIYFCVLTYVLTGHSPTSQYVFVTTSFYEVLRGMVTVFFPQGITALGETKISVRRIKQFLLYNEMETTNSTVQKAIREKSEKSLNNIDDYIMEPVVHNKHSDIIVLNNVNTKWIESSEDNALESINLTVKFDELVAIVGPVGSGKTTLLHLVLKELTPSNGSVNVNGTISYASQEPWLFTGSIRQNILFGQEYVSYKYQEVVRVCALQRDFSLFPHNDRTIVGERGVTLSGGQRARINLARAIYKDADIYLLDDPLSAVDTHVGKHLFDKCVAEYLKHKCVLLVTHQLQYLQKADNIVLMKDGTIEASGNYNELKASGKEFAKLLATLDEEEKQEQENRRRSSRKPSERPDDEKIEDEPDQEKENMGSGNISWPVYRTYFFSGGPLCLPILLVISFVVAQVFASGVDYFLTFWVNLIQQRDQIETNLNTTSNSSAYHSDTVYFTENNCLILYSVLVALGVIITVSRSIGFFVYCMNVSKTLHNNMFKVIVHASMKFFNSNPSGRILNRFSKDMGYIDEALPLTMMDTIQIGLIVLAITIVVASVNPWVLIPSVIMLILFYILRTIFLATSRDIKRLEGITRSPIFSHLTASLQGLTTIRAFGAQDILKCEFDHYQDAYSGAYYMFIGTNRTFGFWLDMHCVIYIALVTFGFLFMNSETFGGNVGLAITQSITLTGMFQWGMRQWSEMENQMTSVERVKEYMDLKPEVDGTTKIPPKNWPEKGVIKFDNASLRYSSSEPYVLKNLSFQINSTEKVGIVGRTGAGKSSMIVALFRLAETEGKILIDGINTSEISLRELRSKISIIPQEPVLFSGTLRKNLDPFDEYDDDVLWNALEEVELKSAVSDLPRGLESKMSEGGSNFSVGQRQLVCLARAIIRNNKILVLDEATANVDPQTDALIQSTIREKFANCTVLTIAHRLHTIMDADKVLVMDAGRVAQFDHPHVLLKDDKGLFYRLVEQTGRAMAENLASIAEQTYKEKVLGEEDNSERSSEEGK